MSPCRKTLLACALALCVGVLPVAPVATLADDENPEDLIEAQAPTEPTEEGDEAEAYDLDDGLAEESFAQALDSDSAVSSGIIGFMQSIASSSSATSGQKSDAALAIKMLNGTSGSSSGSSPAGWYGNYVSTDGWNSRNALSLVQLKNATTYMETVNNLRRSENLPEIKISLVNMAGAALNTCYSSHVWGHASDSGSGSYMTYSEILAQRYGAYTGSTEAANVTWPFSAWYTNEKNTFDQYVEKYGDELESLRHNAYGVYSSSTYSYIYAQCGHYLNIVDSRAKAFGVGTGCGKGTTNGVTIIDFSGDTDRGRYYTVDKFKELVDNYINSNITNISNANVSVDDQTYTGSALTPSPTVTINGKTLTDGCDYTVSYSNNTSAGTATVTITGTGLFEGSVSKTFAINRASISGAKVYTSARTYTGSALETSLSVYVGGKSLVKDTDYTVSYSNNVNAGAATVIITGIGNYTDKATGTFTINRASISSNDVSIGMQEWTGSALTPEATVTHNGKTLVKGTDYTISFSNNINIGRATATVTGIGNYTGEASVSFWIGQADASKATVTVSESLTYTGSRLTPAATVKLGEKTLVENTDYTLTYADNVKVGIATVKASFKGNYSGIATGSFAIKPADASGAAVSVSGSYTYTGSAITPAASIKLGNKWLNEGADYTLAYSNNVNAGTATVTATFQGNYTGKAAGTFTISKASMNKANVSVSNQVYTGSALTPAPTVTFGETTLKSGTDYDVSYQWNTDVGGAKVTVTGKGNFTGTRTAYFNIYQADASRATVKADNQAWTGSALTPAPTVTFDGRTLKQWTDYTVAYSNNTSVGTATMTVTFKGNYKGTATGTFKINAKDASRAVVKASDQVWTGAALTPAPTVALDGVTLTQGTDYTVKYSDNVNIGKATVTAIFKGNYAGTASGTFTISKASVASASVSVARQTYTGAALTPAVTVRVGDVTLARDKDYTVSYANNVNAGTAKVTVTGKGDYSGTRSASFTIDAADASKAKVTAADQAWTGNAITPTVKVELNGKVLSGGTDYTVAYSNNVNAGDARATVTFRGNYKGTATGTFKINARDASRAVVKASDQVWTGKALTPAPTVTFDGKTLKQGTDYTVSYANNTNVGTATATVAFRGNYTGKATGTFRIAKRTVTRITMTRLYNQWSGEHLYTSSDAEIKQCVKNGWKNEGTAWVAPSWSNTPVYRLYNPFTGDHHYTTSKSEYDECARNGWRQEGVGWYSDDAKGKPLYRGYNPYVSVGTHHYTTDWGEMSTMKKNGWKYEGIAWYGLK